MRQWINLIPIKELKKKKNRTDQQPRATLNASCKLFLCAREPPFCIPTAAMSEGEKAKTAASPDVVQLTGVLDAQTQTLMMRRRSSSRSLPWRPAPARSQKLRIPRTSERQQRPDGTCSSSPRRLSSIAWSPEKEWCKQMGGWRCIYTQRSASVVPRPGCTLRRRPFPAGENHPAHLLSPVVWSSASPLHLSAPSSGSSALKTSCWCLASWGSGRSQPGTTGWEWTRLG